MQLVDVLPIRILRIEEASSVDMETIKTHKNLHLFREATVLCEMTRLFQYLCSSAFRAIVDWPETASRFVLLFFLLCGHLCQNMLSNLSSLLRNMFPTCVISRRKTFASFFVFLQFFVVFDPVWAAITAKNTSIKNGLQ